LIGNYPEAGPTVKSVDAYESTMEEVRSAVAPELELIQSRIVGPLKELQGIIKTIRKTITKREHKVLVFLPSSPKDSDLSLIFDLAV
jgi:amphiphysin